MFERFTPQARGVVVQAQDEARGRGDRAIAPEHLLLGLLEEDGVAARVLADAGVHREDVCAASDADALAAIGIDLDAVRARVEAVFGPGALERRRGCTDDRIPLGPATKKALELAVREAKSLRDDYIGSEHLLLALAREEHPALTRRGLSHARVLELVRC